MPESSQSTYPPVVSARRLLRKFGMRTPKDIDLRLIAADRRILVQQKRIQGAEGRLVYCGGRGTIVVNASITSFEKKRFIIAHELGHVELHRTADSITICDEEALKDYKRKRFRETEANEFAGELLMPEDLFVAACDAEPPSIGLIRKLASTFQASLTATAIRYVRVGPVPAAIILTQGGFVRWFWPSEDFPCRYMEAGGHPPAQSVAAKAVRDERAPAHPGVVTAPTWFGRGARRDRYFNEDVHLSEHYDRTLSILWEYSVD